MRKNNAGLKKETIVKGMFFLMTGIILFTLPEQSFSQPPPLPDNPEQTPIDGGLGILAALGGAYAIKKLREKE